MVFEDVSVLVLVVVLVMVLMLVMVLVVVVFDSFDSCVVSRVSCLASLALGLAAPLAGVWVTGFIYTFAAWPGLAPKAAAAWASTDKRTVGLPEGSEVGVEGVRGGGWVGGGW